MSGSGMPNGPPERLPTKGPAAYLDYTFDVTKVITNPRTGAVDPIVSATLANRPSGTGEITATRLSVDGGFITWWESGGVPGRSYTLDLQYATEGGRNYQTEIGQECGPRLTTIPLPIEPSPGYGPPITWSFMPGFDLTNPLNSGYTLLLAGF